MKMMKREQDTNKLGTVLESLCKTTMITELSTQLLSFQPLADQRTTHLI